MRLNKLVKGLAIALPIMALTACSSNDAADSAAQTTTNTPVTENTSTVETGTATRIKTPEEIRHEKMEQLRREHIVYFEFDKSRIEGEFTALLDAHAEFLRENSNVKVLIEGHSDERGTPEYNIALGERRAIAVSRYLMSSGVAQSQITTVSYGEEKPAIRTRTEDAFSKNRRAVIVY